MSRQQQSGLSLIELMTALVLSAGMILVLMQLYVQVQQALDRHQAVSSYLGNIATVQHILSHTIRDALFFMEPSDNMQNFQAVNSDVFTEASLPCPGVLLNQQCRPPLIAWQAEAGDKLALNGPEAGTLILQIKQRCCSGVIADIFYIAHRGGQVSNPPSLYRRRLMSDGRYGTAEELVEGVDNLSLTVLSAGYLALQAPAQVDDWWQLRAVSLAYDLKQTMPSGEQQSTRFSFTVAARQFHSHPVKPILLSSTQARLMQEL